MLRYSSSPWTWADFQRPGLMAIHASNLSLSTCALFLSIRLLMIKSNAIQRAAIVVALLYMSSYIAFFLCSLQLITPFTHDVIGGGIPILFSGLLATLTLLRFQVFQKAEIIKWFPSGVANSLGAFTSIISVVSAAVYGYSYTVPLQPHERYSPSWLPLFQVIPVAWAGLVNLSMAAITFKIVYGMRRQLLDFIDVGQMSSRGSAQQDRATSGSAKQSHGSQQDLSMPPNEQSSRPTVPAKPAWDQGPDLIVHTAIFTSPATANQKRPSVTMPRTNPLALVSPSSAPSPSSSIVPFARNTSSPFPSLSSRHTLKRAAENVLGWLPRTITRAGGDRTARQEATRAFQTAVLQILLLLAVMFVTLFCSFTLFLFASAAEEFAVVNTGMCMYLVAGVLQWERVLALVRPTRKSGSRPKNSSVRGGSSQGSTGKDP